MPSVAVRTIDTCSEPIAGEHIFAIFTCSFSRKIPVKNPRDRGDFSPGSRGKIPAIAEKNLRYSGENPRD
jgi:hypothetical protein